MVDLIPNPIETAPKDNTLLRLLIDYSAEDSAHPLEDASLAWTVGFNNDDNVGDGEGQGWQFAGWSWQQDHFTEGRGKVVGWLPFHGDLEATKRLSDEVTYWRLDAAARLRTAVTLAKAADARSEEARAAELRVGIIMPTRAALAAALAGDLHWPCCEGCDAPIQPGDVVYRYEGMEYAHVDCANRQMAEVPPEAARIAEDPEYTPEGIARALSAAEAYLAEG